MRIHSLLVKNFRALEHLEITALPETGVIIIEGDNEAGKSTILDAIDLVLQERSTSKKKQVKACAPVGRDVGPEVTLRATVGQYAFTVSKRWLKSAKCELTLTKPERRNFTGREADDQLERILQDSLDEKLLATLFLRQGQLDPGVQAAGIASVATALQEASGEVDAAAGAEDTALMEAVEEHYAEYWTAGARPKPKAGYAALIKARDDASTARDNAMAELERLTGFVDEVARREDELRRIEDELPAAEEEAARRQREAEEAAQLGKQAAQAQDRLDREVLHRERAEAALAARRVLAQRVETAETAVEALRAQVEPACEAAQAEQVKISELIASRDIAHAEVKKQREEAKRATRMLDLLRARRDLKSCDDLLDQVKNAVASYRKLVETSPARLITDEDLEKVNAAHTEVALQRRLRDAAAAKLELTAEGETVIVDGDETPVDGTVGVEVFDGTELRIGGVQLIYRAAQDAKDPRAGVEQAEHNLAELLEALGCATADEVQLARDAHREHALNLAAAKRRRDELLGGSDLETLQAKRAGVAQAITELTAVLGDDIPDTQQVDASNDYEADCEEEIQRGVDTAERELGAAERRVEEIEAALKPYADRSAAHALTKLEAQLEAKESELNVARRELAAAEAETPAAQLTAVLKTAQDNEAEAQAVAQRCAQDAAAADPQLMDSLAQGAKTRVATLSERRAQASNRITELTGRIELATGAAEKADRAEAQLERAEVALSAATRRAEAIRLLRDTLVAHRDAARARYSAPFRDALRKHAQVLYGPGVEFNLGQALEVTDRTMGGATVPMSELSGGTKEQLAVLTRFAIADLMSHSGATAPVPVVVDDALGATDPDRLSRMNLLFNQVGDTAQVIVLTCFPQRFDRVDAVRRYRIEDLKHPTHEGLTSQL